MRLRLYIIELLDVYIAMGGIGVFGCCVVVSVYLIVVHLLVAAILVGQFGFEAALPEPKDSIFGGCVLMPLPKWVTEPSFPLCSRWGSYTGCDSRASSLNEKELLSAAEFTGRTVGLSAKARN